MENYVTEEQSYLGPYCLQYKLHKNINSKLLKREADEKLLNKGLLEKK